MYKLVIALFFTAFSYVVQAQSLELHLYGGHEYKDYLGCLTCSNQNSKSVWNTNSIYGSQSGAFSIWNKFGNYGNDFGIYSAFNENATNPPIIKDNRGKIHGYFTLDRFKKGRFENYIVNKIYSEYKTIRDNPSLWYTKNYEILNSL